MEAKEKGTTYKHGNYGWNKVLNECGKVGGIQSA